MHEARLLSSKSLDESSLLIASVRVELRWLIVDAQSDSTDLVVYQY
jgi:hypothetical protein